MKIAIASDHAGFEQKQALIKHLCESNFEVVDFGPSSDKRVDYPDYAKKVGDFVADKKADFGVLVCGTGIGMAISSNKIYGVRAANVINPNFAKLAREHNDANVVCLSGRFVDLSTNIKCVDAFISTKFDGGRHVARLKKITDLEAKND